LNFTIPAIAPPTITTAGVAKKPWYPLLFPDVELLFTASPWNKVRATYRGIL